MASDKARDGIREAMKTVGGLLQDLLIEHRMFFQQCVAGETKLEIRQIDDGPIMVGTYVRHDEVSVTIMFDGHSHQIGFLAIDGIDRIINEL